MFGLFVYWKNQQNIKFWVFLSFIIIIFNNFFFLVREFNWQRTFFLSLNISLTSCCNL